MAYEICIPRNMVREQEVKNRKFEDFKWYSCKIQWLLSYVYMKFYLEIINT